MWIRWKNEKEDSGHIPTPEAFRRGSYETTLGSSSMLAPEPSELIGATAVDPIGRLRQQVEGG